MKALVLTEYNHLQIQDMPQPSCGPDEVLLRVRACGICGSDIHGMDGSTGRRQPPIIMGHEAAGEIAEVGAEVAGFRPGRPGHVRFDGLLRPVPVLPGRARSTCATTAACSAFPATSTGGTAPSPSTWPCRDRILYRLPDEVSYQRAALVEPASIAFHAVHRLKIHLGDMAVVVGTGMVGLLVVQALRAAGCGRLIAVDLDPQRLKLACQLGADEGLDARDAGRGRGGHADHRRPGCGRGGRSRGQLGRPSRRRSAAFARAGNLPWSGTCHPRSNCPCRRSSPANCRCWARAPPAAITPPAWK